MSNKTAFVVDPSRFGKVAVLMGGWSAEREVSLKSGHAVLEALQASGIDAHGIDVQQHDFYRNMQEGQYDRAFIVMHGRGGEDGVMQGALEVLNIPYTGSGVLASAIAMDKLRCKQLLEGVGLPTPPYMVLEENSDSDYVVATLGLPLMVKPALEGSSIGMTKVVESEQLKQAWHTASQYGSEVIVEKWITGAEYTVAVLGEKALPAIKLETKRDFYDYFAKYQANDTRYICPCGLSEEKEGQLQRLALAAFKAIGAKGWGRVDILTSQDGQPWVIELNTVPGMTDHSLVPMAAKQAGMNFQQLVVSILENSMEQAN